VLPVALVIGGAMGWMPWRLVAALGVGGVLVAGVGWLDDHRATSARLRLAVHFAAAAWAVAWLGGYPSVSLGSFGVDLGASGAAIAIVGIVWAVNAYNFMDGIDGIAAGEAVVVAGCGGLLMVQAHPQLAAVSFVVSATSAGFLVLNWAPAKIFLGDVGSGLLGYCFGVLAVGTENAGALPALAWIILLGVFVVDATVTLARRLSRREQVYRAHREHAYQRAVQAGATHKAVASAVVVLDLALALLAYWGTRRLSRLPVAVGVAGSLLTAIYIIVERYKPMARRPAARPPG
jgi:Fuc2NAc and GlcNAc transferase